MSIYDFIRPELMILVPVMYLLGIAIKKSPVRDYLIPFFLGFASVAIATIYVLATSLMVTWQDWLLALFTAITQGILAAGASTYLNQLYKQGKAKLDITNSTKNFIPPAADPLLLVDLVKSGNKVRGGQVHIKNKIVIHDTGNKKLDADALAHSSYLHNMAALNTTYISWHYTVDADRIVQHIPDNEVAWHAGDGTTGTGGNVAGIGIEMCINDMDRFEAVLHNTAWLVARLMLTYGWELGAIKQHYDCNKKDCPHEVRRIFGKWNEFLAMCQTEYEKLLAPPEQYNRVQVGAWQTEALATAYAAKLRMLQVDGEPVQAVIRCYDGFFRAQVGAWSYESLAKAFAKKLRQCQIDGRPVQAVIKRY